MLDNNADRLKAMYLPSRQDIRKFDEIQSVTKQKEDEVSKKIQSFFILNEDGIKWCFNE